MATVTGSKLEGESNRLPLLTLGALTDPTRGLGAAAIDFPIVHYACLG